MHPASVTVTFLLASWFFIDAKSMIRGYLCILDQGGEMSMSFSQGSGQPEKPKPGSDHQRVLKGGSRGRTCLGWAACHCG